MRTLACAVMTIVVLAMGASRAHAQPGASQPYAPPPAGYGQPQPYMTVQLTLDEQFLLERGYISQGEHIGGGIAALFFGWGIGHAVQGRWSDKGYIFTLGEGVTTAIFVWGMFELFGECWEGCNETQEQKGAMLMIGGLVGLSVFRVWEVVDAFAGPQNHNRRLRELHTRLGMQPAYSRLTPYIVPAREGDGALAGVSLRF